MPGSGSRKTARCTGSGFYIEHTKFTQQPYLFIPDIVKTLNFLRFAVRR